ncbi:hypothetical protein EYF80_043210 [Liparis tanakae]|uniref:Uncharacterized protein n=1 Tax=Liparis tanakae TaxID=230148 RepID=A0A4Z2FZZ9_9TELE|nr:hypothetical protein EYF80_043210 [Liparis tanakae]
MGDELPGCSISHRKVEARTSTLRGQTGQIKGSITPNHSLGWPWPAPQVLGFLCTHRGAPAPPAPSLPHRPPLRIH